MQKPKLAWVLCTADRDTRIGYTNWPEVQPSAGITPLGTVVGNLPRR